MKKLIFSILLAVIAFDANAQNMDAYKFLTNLSLGKRQVTMLEKLYQDKLNDKEMYQYGYSDINDKNRYISAAGVQDDYILGIGDELNISLVGSKTETYHVKVNKQGQLVIEGLAPMSVSTMTIKEVKEVLQSKISKIYLDTKVYLSIDEVRFINVSVMGEVKNPGTYNMSSLSKLTDALSMAGGIKKSGTLRNIKVNSEGAYKEVDLYELFAGIGNFEDVQLRQGTNIVVPTIGKTIAVTGDAEKKGIFELNGDGVSLIEKISGVSANDKVERAKFSGGEFLIVTESEGNYETADLIIGDKVEIISTDKNKYLEDVFSHLSNSEKRDMYPLFAIIERFDAKTLNISYEVFNPFLVMNKRANLIKINPADKIILFTKKQIEEFQSPVEKDEEEKVVKEEDLKHKNILEKNAVYVYGEVAQEGIYPIADKVVANDILKASGGILPSAKEDSIEIISSDIDGAKNYSFKELDNIYLSRGDSVRVKSKFDLVESGTVTINGEVKYPGDYNFVRGEKLSSLIARAGGLTNEAYAYGTVYSRESARVKEKQKYKQAAIDLQASLADYLANEKEPNQKQVQAINELIKEIESAQALGRIVVEADPDVLSKYPEEDVLLQAKDQIYVPKRSLTVQVMGEVLNPSNLKFNSGNDAHEYIKGAGGYSYYADKDRGFVLLPDGSSSPIKSGSWNFAEMSIPEGSTVIVPRDPNPYNFMDVSLFITNVLSQIAITTASIADIKDD